MLKRSYKAYIEFRLPVITDGIYERGASLINYLVEEILFECTFKVRYPG